jgi:DNA-binding NarL/FixJ family response regulator
MLAPAHAERLKSSAASDAAEARAVKPVRIAVVEDDRVLRDGLCQLLSTIEGFELVAAVGTLREGQRLFRPELEAKELDVLLLDLQLPDGSGLDLLALGRAQCPGIKVVVLSVFGDVQHVVRAIEQGADGYLLKGADAASVTTAIHTVMQGGAPISPAVAGHILARVRNQAPPGRGKPPEFTLTDKEAAVLTHLARGLSYKEIAEIQHISYHTVADHVKSIYRKLAVNSRSEAVFEAVQSGLICLRS